MPTRKSLSKTATFFKKYFDRYEEMNLEFLNRKMLLSFEKKEDHYMIFGEFLDKPVGSDKVSIRLPENCDCKSDIKRYIPTFTFKVFFKKEGFHYISLNNDDPKIKSILKDLERALIKFED